MGKIRAIGFDIAFDPPSDSARESTPECLRQRFTLATPLQHPSADKEGASGPLAAKRGGCGEMVACSSGHAGALGQNMGEIGKYGKLQNGETCGAAVPLALGRVACAVHAAEEQQVDSAAVPQARGRTEACSKHAGEAQDGLDTIAGATVPQARGRAKA